jgi:glycosyltransferase involved in cell wall biosynthesis
MSTDQIVLSIIIPLFNESENIDALYSRMIRVLSNMGEPFEIIFINDGSLDSTLQCLHSIRDKDNRIKVIDLSRNFGKEIAISAGLDFASGKGLIFMDADLQDPPEIIPDLAAKWRQGYDVVYAKRTDRSGESWLRRLTANLFYIFIDKITDIDIPRDTGDFRLISRHVADAIKILRERNRFMKGMFSWVGFRCAPVFYTREPRHAGRSKLSYRKLWNLAVEGITSFSYLPLKLATYMGLLLSLFAFSLFIFMLVSKFIYGNTISEFIILTGLILFISGMQSLFTGILGEYVGRIYEESKHRPLYIVRGTYGFDLTK